MNMNRALSISAMRQQGFTIVEALITFLILSVGLLGMAGLQTKSIQMDQNSYQRSQAAMLAQDINDRMRSNVEATRDGSYAIGYGDAAASSTDCVHASCDGAQLTEFDLAQWKQSLASLLPSGDGKIEAAVSATSAPAMDVTITIYWDEYRSGATGTNCPPQSKADLSCFTFQSTL